MFSFERMFLHLLGVFGCVIALLGASPSEAAMFSSNSAAALKGQIERGASTAIVDVKKKGRRGFRRGFRRRGFRGRRYRGRRYRGPRFGIYLYPYAVPYYGRRYYRGGRCNYWSRVCARNWGFRTRDYYGCLRYHGC